MAKRAYLLSALVWMLICVGARVTTACSRVRVITKVGPQFRLHVTDRGAPAVGVRYELRKKDNSKGNVIAFAVTDSGGFANFSNLEPGILTLGRKSESLDERAEFEVSDKGKIGTTVEWTLPKWNPIKVRAASGTLIGPQFYPTLSQAPFSLALLDAENSEEIKTTKSDSKGHFSFGRDVLNGRYFLQISIEQIRSVGGRVLIEIRPAAKSAELDLDLSFSSCGLRSLAREDREEIETSAVCGTVEGTNGWPIAEYLDGRPVLARVFLLKDGEGFNIAAETQTDASGKFQFKSLTSGVYRLVVPDPTFYQGAFVQVVHVRPGNSDGCATPIFAKLQQMYD